GAGAAARVLRGDPDVRAVATVLAVPWAMTANVRSWRANGGHHNTAPHDPACAGPGERLSVPPATAPAHPGARRCPLGLPGVAAAVVAVATLWVAVALLQPLPPRTLIMATGLEGGAYQEIGRRYREILARHGVTLELLLSARGPGQSGACAT